MPELWYPKATQDPGVSAGYVHGRVYSMLSVVTHYTVGVDSRGLIRDQGLAEFLVARDGTIWQFCEVDAICYQAGYPYNGRGPGIEVEYYPDTDDAIFTAAARTACGGLVRWLNSEWGIPLTYYDDTDNRIGDYVGFISHRSVIEDAAYHHDYWPRSDWDQMVSTPAPTPLPPKPKEFTMIRLVSNTENSGATYELHEASGERHYVGNPTVVAAMKAAAAASIPPVPVLEYDCDDEYLVGWKLIGPGFNGK